MSNNPNASQPEIIAVSSGKGGVGKSTVSVNLTLALAERGLKVGLMDMDIYGPNLPTMMGVLDPPRIEKDPQGNEFFVPPRAHGVPVMSMGFLVEPDQPVIWRGPMIHNILKQFSSQVAWGDIDYLVMDLPPGTGDVQISLSQLMQIRAAVCVTTPQAVALEDVRRALVMWDKVKVPVLGLVENMSYFECGSCSTKHHIFGEGGAQVLADQYDTEVLGHIPLESNVREAGDDGAPQIIREPKSKSAEAFRQIAEKVVARVEAMKSEGVKPEDILKIGTFSGGEFSANN